MTIPDLLILAGVGLGAGLIGGMLGLGGSIIMIPVLAGLMHHDQHLVQAAAMWVNVVVVITATVKHACAGTIPRPALLWMIVPGLLCVTLGIWISGLIPSAHLTRVFGGCLIVLCIWTLWLMRHPEQTDNPDAPPPILRHGPIAAIGATLGLLAGLLSIGGGIMAVPTLHRHGGLRLKPAIALASATMCATAPIGAAIKLFHIHHMDPAKFTGGVAPTTTEILLLAVTLAPAAILGSWIGASLTHRMPTRRLQWALGLALLVSGAKMLFF